MPNNTIFSCDTEWEIWKDAPCLLLPSLFQIQWTIDPLEESELVVPWDPGVSALLNVG